MQTTTPYGHNANSLPHPIDQLHLVMGEIETFFAAWMQRLEQLNSVEQRPDERVEKMRLELEEEKRRWEARRVRESQDIHDKAEELAKAWLRLEEEERRFLQSRESRQVASRPAGSETARADRPPVDKVIAAQPEPETPQPTIHHSGDGPTLRRANMQQASPLRESAIRQFEQLRREIQTSRQHRRHA